MLYVELPQAQAELAQLLGQVLSGEEVIISQAGTPIARIVPIDKPSVRIPGLDRDQVVIAADFDDPLPEDILNDFLCPVDQVE
ncbi:type II toxin-antitoxin system prevent-host-death family antitoxin [Gloeocapsopsis sp. IPPAS B-1203]|uniref:type II toxin-antitoxin system Phd/YefM family antitoxin n=1 Tax=Gloeocapsopsis sp. IPPAS B-1203 TaxID=2049454 RepID=UPI000C174D5F|nr:type II toxin-antitoxin system prevent-host-death family antitoxin [Gloeocapsopsis sp. IPPAS B-1203]PIG95478.1 antitoxin [Gloeocapsopsis sp. IPPAS B-1203]